MGTVVLHAGRPKTGSSSIQLWIQNQERWLRRQGVVPAVAHWQGPDGRCVTPYRSGPVTSINFVRSYRERGQPRAMVQRLVADLDRLASEGATVVVSAENLSGLLTKLQPQISECFGSLGRRHRVRIAYYVRPQHSAIEAAWCQWGFRLRDRTPSEFVQRAAREYRYLETVERCRAAMPDVDFVVRPFRSDLLVDGNVVSDFTTTLLSLPAAPGRDGYWANPGLPMEAANLLHHLPDDLIPIIDHGDLGVLKRHHVHWKPADSDETRRARAALTRFCREEFEPDNLKLIRAEGWETDHFVPVPVPEDEVQGGAGGDLTALDTLWAPTASPGERELVYLLLKDLLQHDELRRADARRPSRRAIHGVKTLLRRRIGSDAYHKLARHRKRP